MKYAVIQSGGKQYKVEEGKEILIDRLNCQEGEKVNFDRILLVRTDEEILIGDPLVKGAKVSGRLIKEIKGKKLKVSKFKAKVRYRKTIGFRPKYSQVLIEKISLVKKKDK